MTTRTTPAASYFKDIVLTDQNGHRVRLYEDVMKDRTIVMNSFFATCKGACPIMTGTYTSLQDRFADHLGKDLMFVSITVDPTNDTPPKLAEYARKAKALADQGAAERRQALVGRAQPLIEHLVARAGQPGLHQAGAHRLDDVHLT